jgi:hypothetical protein
MFPNPTFEKALASLDRITVSIAGLLARRREPTASIEIRYIPEKSMWMAFLYFGRAGVPLWHVENSVDTWPTVEEAVEGAVEAADLIYETWGAEVCVIVPPKPKRSLCEIRP